MLRSRFLCTKVANNPHQWCIKQVSKSNFSESLEDLKSHIFSSDFVAVSLQKTGSFSAPWHRVLPFDTADTAYFKSKYAAERFQVLQFAVCPFSIKASKVVAYPYNFHLFPRDELKMGMPSYSFSCQTSYLTSMAREGFDFNACIYDAKIQFRINGGYVSGYGRAFLNYFYREVGISLILDKHHVH